MVRRRYFVYFAALVAALLFVAGGVMAQGGATLSIAPASSSLAVGQSSTLSVQISGVANLAAAEVHLTFDPNVLEVTQLSNGGFVFADFVAQNVFNNSAGTIDYAVAQMNRPPASGSGTFLVISFRAKSSGASTIAFTSAILADGNGAPIPANLVPGTVTVGGGGVTPVATTPAPVATTPAPVATTPAPVATTPAPVATTPAPVATTPAPVATTPAPPPSSSAILGYHTVKPNETLYCIGRAYHVSPWAIAGQNYIPWPYWVYPGQVLAIPNVPAYNIPPGPVCQPQFGTVPPTVTPPPVTPPPVTPPPPPSACRYYHTVWWGQTLSGIAWYYGVTVQAIMRANPSIVNPNLVYAGQVLCIP